jgi:tRNA(fMet)-specific endonuclease VapC
MNQAVLLDTNIISYQFRNDLKYELYKPYLTNKILMVSFQTRAEVERWILARAWGAKKQTDFFAFYQQFIEIPHSLEISKRWAQAKQSAFDVGKPIPADDAWIAATALELEIPLVTHNKSDFLGVKNLEIIAFQEG